MASEKIHTSY